MHLPLAGPGGCGGGGKCAGYIRLNATLHTVLSVHTVAPLSQFFSPSPKRSLTLTLNLSQFFSPFPKRSLTLTLTLSQFFSPFPKRSSNLPPTLASHVVGPVGVPWQIVHRLCVVMVLHGVVRRGRAEMPWGGDGGEWRGEAGGGCEIQNVRTCLTEKTCSSPPPPGRSTGRSLPYHCTRPVPAPHCSRRTHRSRTRLRRTR